MIMSVFSLFHLFSLSKKQSSLGVDEDYFFNGWLWLLFSC